MAGEEANESSCKAVALCVDVEVVERDARLEIAVVNIAVEVTDAKVVKPQMQRGRGDDGSASRQSSWEGAMPRSTQSRPSWS